MCRALNLVSVERLLDLTRACQTARLPGDRLKFCIGPHHVGYVDPTLAEALIPDFTLTKGTVCLPHEAAPHLNAIVAPRAKQFGIRWRSENFDVRARVGGDVLAVLDRGAIPAFGIIGVGVHLNGIVRRSNGPFIWVAKRSSMKQLDPGKYDSLVGGGVPSGFSPRDALIKEAAEEASIGADIIANAREVSRVDYAMQRPEGLRRDHLVCYDLELAEDFVPRPNDGEVDGFELWPAAQVLETMLTNNAFKFNVNLVLIDWLIREKLLSQNARERLRAALLLQTAEPNSCA